MSKKITTEQALMTIAIACIATFYKIIRDFLYWAFRIEFKRERARRVHHMQSLLDEEHQSRTGLSACQNV